MRIIAQPAEAHAPSQLLAELAAADQGRVERLLSHPL